MKIQIIINTVKSTLHKVIWFTTPHLEMYSLRAEMMWGINPWPDIGLTATLFSGPTRFPWLADMRI